MSDRVSLRNLEDRVRDLEDRVYDQNRTLQSQGALIQVLLLSRANETAPINKRSRSRSPTPLPLPRKRDRSRSPPAAGNRRELSDYNIHIRGWPKDLLEEDVVNYIDSMYNIAVISCKPDAGGFTACIRCNTKEDQQFLLGEKAPEIMGRFGFKGLYKRFI